MLSLFWIPYCTYFIFLLVKNKANENQTPIFFVFRMRMPIFPTKKKIGLQGKKQLQNLDAAFAAHIIFIVLILTKIRIVKMLEVVKSFKILLRLFLYDCILPLGQNWLRINKSADIQMQNFYAVQIYVFYQRMHSSKKLSLFL